MSKKMKNLGLAAVTVAVSVLSTHARAEVIDFENLAAGPSFASQATAGSVTETTSIGAVIFHNGAILTNEASLPADTTNLFYNSFFLPHSGGASMTINFASNITNFFFNLYNGQVYADTFTVSDNMGNSTTVTIAPNTASGVSLISFPAAGDVVTITTADTLYDYSIDNVGFNQPTPGVTAVPEPTTWALLMLGMGALSVSARKRRSRR